MTSKPTQNICMKNRAQKIKKEKERKRRRKGLERGC
jgi:hypothetical protein